MNNQPRNTDKRIAILLIAAFAWLFIGSLIIFHEEHVLGKHFSLTSQLFISPKSNEKKDYSFDVQKLMVKFQDSGAIAGLITTEDNSDLLRISLEFKSKESSSSLPDDVCLKLSSLRAPPVA